MIVKKSVTIMIPCYNEEKSLPLLYTKLIEITDNLPDYSWQFLFINDGSQDSTITVLNNLHQEDHRVKYIDLSRNFGKEIAMMAGLDNFKGDVMIIMDADLQNPPEIIPEMLKYWEEGYDDVYAKKNSRGKESWIRKKLSLKYYALLQKSTKMEIYPNVGDFRLLDRRCVDALKEMREKVRYTKGFFSYIGFKKKGIEYDVADRIEGESKWSYFKLLELAIDGLTSFTILPLRIATITGFLISFLAFIYMFFVLFRTMIYGEVVRGFPTLIIIILFLGGIQLLALGVIGEYIGRIFIETKNRPNYFIREKNL